MKHLLSALAVASAVTALSVADAKAKRKPFPAQPGMTGVEFVISCYRGPFSAVAWDRPNAIFLDELVEYGYNQEEVIMIVKRVCRDEYGVRNEDWMRDTLLRLLVEQPPGFSNR